MDKDACTSNKCMHHPHWTDDIL